MANVITSDDAKLLFNALGANGVFSGVSGLIMVFASDAIAEFLGLSQSRLIFELGMMLIAFGAILVFYYRRKRIHIASAIVITMLDLGWVIGSAVLVVAMPELFSTAGIVAVIAVAVIVLTLFDLQAYAIWRTRQSALPSSSAQQTT
ncbi:MAG: hypothetical protein ACR2Q3_09605 [Woeseiaceae bacterium]